jgi:hypothetical protein
VNKSKTREQSKKEKTKYNALETSKQQPIVNQTKTPLQMNYNMVDELPKFIITLPSMEVVKIPQQRENILKKFDDTDLRIEATMITTKQQHNVSSVIPRGKVPPFYISIENHDFSLHNFLVDSGATTPCHCQ